MATVLDAAMRQPMHMERIGVFCDSVFLFLAARGAQNTENGVRDGPEKPSKRLIII